MVNFLLQLIFARLRENGLIITIPQVADIMVKLVEQYQILHGQLELHHALISVLTLLLQCLVKAL